MPTSRGDAHRREHRRQGDFAGVAGRAGRGGDFGRTGEDVRADAADERHVERVGQAPVGRTVEDDAIAERHAQALPQCLAHAQGLGSADRRSRNLAGLAKRRREQRALGAGPPPALVAGAVDERFERNPAPHVERADALRRVELVAGEREKVHAEVVDSRFDLADRLCRVGMEEDPMLAGDPRRLRDRLDGANLVVGVHEADEDRIASNRLADIVGVDEAKAIDRHERDRRAEPFEEAARFENGGVFDRGGDDMRRLAAAGQEHPFEREIVGFAAAAREYDLVGFATQERGDLRPRPLERRLGAGARPMAARRIAVELLREAGA